MPVFLSVAVVLAAQGAPAPAATPPPAAPPPATAPAAGTPPPAAAPDGGAAAAPAPAPAEDAETVVQTVADSVFEDGVKAFDAGDYRVAAEAFWHFLSGNEQTAEHYEWSEYYLARSFLRMGLNHAGVEYLYNVAKERKRPELLPEALRDLEKIREVLPYDDELIDTDLLRSGDFGALPPDVKSFVEYQQGRLDLLDGRPAWAERHFDRLSRTSDDEQRVQRYALRAKLAQALADLKTTHAQDTKVRRDTREAAQKALEEISASKIDDFKVKNDAKRVLAEVLFERKEFDAALKVYNSIEVPFLSEEEANLFLEKAWARYYKGDARGALGILLTLDAPSYRKYFKPERFVLKALAYKTLCHYAAAKASAREFLRRYGSSLEEVRRSRDPLTDPVVRTAAVQRKKPKRIYAFLDSLQRERDQVDRFSDEFGLATHLARIYDLKIAEVNRELDRVVKQEGVKVATELLDYEEQARLVDYEVSLEVFRRLKKGRGKKVVDQEAPVPLGSRQVYYRFDGEYWNDELHDYRFRIDNRCFGEELFE
ncbi:MAG: hypothetical protein HYS27_16995 [Deltaproteobacteria bacterium]|nr:hypothetical protein [Deltaproteobacteria bacterium]